MPHRAQQIVDQVAALLAANSALGAAVYRHRSEPLAAGEGEVPAVVVEVGEDSPFDGDGALSFNVIDSLLEINCRCVAQADDDPSLLEALHELRRQVHMTLMADRSLALAFVIDTRYAGALAPEFSIESERIVGLLDTRWAIHYRMNITDPN
jgi:hypothetical protein